MNITISEIKAVTSILFVVGAALSWGEVRIQRGEDHREKYEQIITAMKNEIKTAQTSLAVLHDRQSGGRLAYGIDKQL